MTTKRDRPSTTENEHQNTCSVDKMSQISNVTDHDDHNRQGHCSALSNLSAVPQAVEQTNFRLDLAHLIPQVQVPDDLDTPLEFPMPVIPPLRGNDTFAIGGQERPIRGWRDRMNNLPSLMPVGSRGRGRPRKRVLLSGEHQNVALNDVHRGQIANGEQTERGQAMHLQHLQELRIKEEQAEQERQLQFLQIAQEEWRQREQSIKEQQAEQERQLQIAQEEWRQRQQRIKEQQAEQGRHLQIAQEEWRQRDQRQREQQAEQARQLQVAQEEWRQRGHLQKQRLREQQEEQARQLEVAQEEWRQRELAEQERQAEIHWQLHDLQDGLHEDADIDSAANSQIRDDT